MLNENQIKNLFVEMPIFHDRDKDTFPDFEIVRKKGKFIKTEKVSQNIEADIFQVTEKNYYKIMFRINQTVIGMVELDTTITPVILFPMVIGIAVREQFRGQGHSKSFYSWMISYYGGIISDETLTGEDGHGSFQLWQWLSKTFPTYIWKSKETVIIPLENVVITNKMMNNRKDHFMTAIAAVDYKSYNAKFAKTFKLPSYARSGIKLTEMPVFQDTHLSMGKKSPEEDEVNQTAYDECRNLISSMTFKDYTIELYSEKHRYMSFVLTENKQIIGRLAATKFREFAAIDYVFVIEDHQKLGLGTQMYKMLIDSIGGCYSDRTLTGSDGGGSFATWQKLGTIYHSYLYRKSTMDVIQVDGFTADLMTNPNDRFLATKLPYKDAKNLNENSVMTEMPQFSDKDKGLADSESFEPPLNATLKKSYPIQHPKAVIDLYEFNSNPDSKELLLRLETGETVGVMSFDAAEDSDLPFPTVMFVGIKESHRGKGLSKLLYDLIIKVYKGIISDATLTGEEGYGSFHTWQSLAKNYNAYIIRSDDTITPVSNITKDMMGSLRERFMMSKYPFDYANHNEKRQLAYTEVRLMSPVGDSDMDSSDPNEWDFISGKKLIEKKIGNGITFIKTKISHVKDVKYALIDNKKNKVISGMRAEINSTNYKVEPNEVQIGSVVTSEPYRQKGWGKLLYKLVLDEEKTLISDSQLYPGTASIWSKYLPTIANVYNYTKDGQLEPFNFAKGTSKAGIDDYFVASTNKLL